MVVEEEEKEVEVVEWRKRRGRGIVGGKGGREGERNGQRKRRERGTTGRNKWCGGAAGYGGRHGGAIGCGCGWLVTAYSGRDRRGGNIDMYLNFRFL